MADLSPWHVTNDEAREHPCPRCHALPDEPCIRVLTAAYGTDPQTVPHWKVNATVGQKMTNVHNERRMLVLMARQLELVPPPPPEPVPLARYRQVALALWEFDQGEQAQLSWWLRVHGHILWEREGA